MHMGTHKLHTTCMHTHKHAQHRDIQWFCLCPVYFIIHYSPAYQNAIFPPIEAAIKQLHTIVNNAETDGYTIVYGVGATNLLYVAIIALSRSIINVSTLDC